ncbi:branched-chain amino acid ABC transporter permease [Tabrizicola aquatica]|uniref:branched-chain amino acid ABC transporter permease n=1 Tax=Tabrizicola aquatica TaxID=909926 RepID=UPI000CD2F950|nr:branched-chain amino acid ABC transporter permease [Tabrizicola aquatica]
MNSRNLLLFGAVAGLYVLTGIGESWNLSLSILNVALLATIAALGVNMQWGYAGLFSTGVMGFTALGALSVVLITAQPNVENWQAGGSGIVLALVLGAASVAAAVVAWGLMPKGRLRALVVAAILIGGFFLFRAIFDPAVSAVEAVNPQFAGNLGGLGLPSLVAWPVGGLLAAAAAWAIGKTALGLRSDYLAIATLGIAEIIVAVIKNEDWLARGVKNVTQLPRPWPVPLEIELQKEPGFLDFVASWGWDPIFTSTILVKLLYAGLFLIVLCIIIWAFERALNSPWGRMMRAIRDNEVSAAAMGKDVTRRHLQVFILGSAVIGFAGAMAASMEGTLTPGSYQPLRFTFLIWVMVIVGGSGNNWGTVLGGLLIGWLYFAVEFLGPNAMAAVTSSLPDGWLKAHLVNSAEHMRLLTLGVILLIVLRFSPRGLIPEK